MGDNDESADGTAQQAQEWDRRSSKPTAVLEHQARVDAIFLRILHDLKSENMGAVSPSLFVVYAHDSQRSEYADYPADADVAKTLIEWFRQNESIVSVANY